MPPSPKDLLLCFFNYCCIFLKFLLYVHLHICAKGHMWRSDDNLQEYMGSEDQTWVFTAGGKVITYWATLLALVPTFLIYWIFCLTPWKWEGWKTRPLHLLISPCQAMCCAEALSPDSLWVLRRMLGGMDLSPGDRWGGGQMVSDSERENFRTLPLLRTFSDS